MKNFNLGNIAEKLNKIPDDIIGTLTEMIQNNTNFVKLNDDISLLSNPLNR